MNNPLLNYLSTRVALIASLIARSAVRYRGVKENARARELLIMLILIVQQADRSGGDRVRQAETRARVAGEAYYRLICLIHSPFDSKLSA